jgi:hypothetical protein
MRRRRKGKKNFERSRRKGILLVESVERNGPGAGDRAEEAQQGMARIIFMSYQSIFNTGSK